MSDSTIFSAAVINGMLFHLSKPSMGQKGLLINRKLFIPFYSQLPQSAGVQAGVLVDNGGTMAVQPLSFEGTTALLDGAVESPSMYVFNTSYGQPQYAGTASDAVES